MPLLDTVFLRYTETNLYRLITEHTFALSIESSRIKSSPQSRTIAQVWYSRYEGTVGKQSSCDSSLYHMIFLRLILYKTNCFKSIRESSDKFLGKGQLKGVGSVANMREETGKIEGKILLDQISYEKQGTVKIT